MKKIFTIFVLFSAIVTTNLSAQNLVPNPGFEIQDSCPHVSDILLAHPWDSPQSGTPDLTNTTCPTQNFPGHSGIGASGIFCYNDAWADNREYIQAPLLSSLVAGHQYCVSFYVKRSNYKYAVDRFGAYFSIGQTHLTMNTDYLPYSPQVENPAGSPLSASGWILISGTFTASGGENNIIIGNFSPDAQMTATIVNAASTSNVAYYQIDDINVSDCTVGIEEDLLVNQISISQMSEGIILVNLPTKYSADDIKIYNL
jgi:OmpA-OmpF porin, OOP family